MENNRLMRLFGFRIGKREEEKDLIQPSFTPPSNDDGALTVTSAAHFGLSTIDLDGTTKNEIELITRYREMSIQPEVESAIDDIVNEAIVHDDDGKSVELVMDNLKQSEKIKKAILDEFSNILKLLNFNNIGTDIFRRYYVDGRLFYHVIVDIDNPQKGIQELRYIDPRKIRKIREIKKQKDPETGVEIIIKSAEYYLYTERVVNNTSGVVQASNSLTGIKIAPDSIVNINSGLMDAKRNLVLSYLNKAFRALNQLRMIEDAVVIYRMSRAAERRIFYIDVGALPKIKAEQYIRDIMTKYKNKLVYDATTGQVADTRRFLSLQEDFWIPRRSDGKSTEITTLPGGCFSMDTKISLLDGRELSIKEIENELKTGKELWTYSCEPKTGKIAPGLISWAGVTQKSAQVLELTLDNGETIICTPDHKFPVYGEQYKKAKDFSIGESLIPLYKQNSPLKPNQSYTLTYEKVFDNNDKKWKFTHRLVASALKDIYVQYKPYLEEFNDGKADVIHHIDFNRYNNSPDNLCFMSWKDHSKLHQDNIQILKENPDYINNLKIGVNNYYKNRSLEEKIQHCERSVNMWKNFSKEKYVLVCKNISKGITSYIKNLNEKDRKIRNEISKKNFSKGSQEYSRKLKEDKEFKEYISKIRKEQWTEEKRNISRKQFKEMNKLQWESEEFRENFRKKQKVDFSHNMLLTIIDLVKSKTTHQITIFDVLNELNNNPSLLEELKELNKSKSVPNWNVNKGFTTSLIRKLVKTFGYNSWEEFRIKESLHNHRIIGIKYLDEPIEVGTLTIDQNEIYHNYHTFALSCGIFTFNSSLGQLEDVEYFEKKLYKSLNVPITRLDPSQTVSIGRSTEITRDELKFSKFIQKLRGKFSEIFDQLLRIQLVLKGICTEEEWHDFKEDIYYDFIKDNKFEELKNAELMQERLGVLALIDQYAGKYYSKKWIQENILRLNEEDILDMKEEMDEERKLDLQQQAIDQQNQIQLQAQALELQNQLMPQPDQQIDAGQEVQPTAQPAQPAQKKANTPYHINNQ